LFSVRKKLDIDPMRQGIVTTATIRMMRRPAGLNLFPQGRMSGAAAK